MEYIVMKTGVYGEYVHRKIKSRATQAAVEMCDGNGLAYQVLKCVATITPKGVTVDDHEKEVE